MSDGEGVKYDDGKPAVALLSSPFLLEMGAVMEFGARKYAAQNWRKGISVTRCLSAALRHTLKWMDGVENDEESGLHHLAHAAVNLMFAAETAMARPSFDDRFHVRKDTNGTET